MLFNTSGVMENLIPVDGHDSGTESDDEIDRPEMLANNLSCPVDPALRDQQYDHHSSEEELEVINSTPKQDKFVRPYPTSAPCSGDRHDIESSAIADSVAAAVPLVVTATALSSSASTPELLMRKAETASSADEKIATDLHTPSGGLIASKQNDRHLVNRLRCASAAAALPMPEKRKWSRVGPVYCHARKSDSSYSHQPSSRGACGSSDPASSDDYDDDFDYDDLLLMSSPPPHCNQHQYNTGCYSTPVRFRSSPPLEALKPANTVSGQQSIVVAAPIPVMIVPVTKLISGGEEIVTKSIKRESPIVIVRRESDEGKTEGSSGTAAGEWTAGDTPMEVRSLSPPSKVFHCSVSPKRRSTRPNSSHQARAHRHTHRPCLDFDKMQQLKARSIPAWRHSNERGGDLSVFCW
ncbi:uncharacterized protein LOC113368088 isoform X2 [Ctenocephalides felis]|uniref:uncharacterized protein LOC113368088 isoform X2 n=1 Tax=Ctenocephalides felis TaxID=7515 RepID=UPI000E6E1624|nr:uncharacterized protein LOC113368088 isoform X2 [Ctenocephalides felis]